MRAKSVEPCRIIRGRKKQKERKKNNNRPRKQKKITKRKTTIPKEAKHTRAKETQTNEN